MESLFTSDPLFPTAKLASTPETAPIDMTNCLVRSGAARDATWGGAQATIGEQAAPSASRGIDPWIGREIRDYTLEELVGVGGMGRVYRARHRWLEMPVAVKIMNDGMAGEEAGIARFRREALAVAKLNHRNIVRATDGGAIDNAFFLVTEFIAGQNVATIVQNQLRLNVADACEVICQAAEALQHAHENQLVHRDIKPSNLMISSTGEVKLLDLGLARFAHGYTTLTETGHVMGTLDFMAPEQAGDTRNVDIRADIYSLGCTLYCLLTGAPPFAGPEYDTAISKIMAHSETEPTPANSLRRNIPAGVMRCLKKMMAKHRDQRFRSPIEVAHALRPFTRGADLAQLVGAAPFQQTGKCDSTNPFGSICASLYVPLVCVAIVLAKTVGVLLRVVLSMIGLVERQSVPTSLIRAGAPMRSHYVLSTKGIINLLFLAILASIIYMSGFRIHFGAPPNGPALFPGCPTQNCPNR